MTTPPCPQTSLKFNHKQTNKQTTQLSDARGGGAMTGLALVDGEANEGEAGGGLAHRINSIVDHAINLNVRAFVLCVMC